MKGWRGSLERVLDWVQDYGWSIPVLGFGVLLGLSLAIGFENPVSWLGIITALGTLGAAFAAFLSVNHARSVQRRRDKAEDEARKPSLRLISVEPTHDVNGRSSYNHEFLLVNISQQAIYLGGVFAIGVKLNAMYVVKTGAKIDNSDERLIELQTLSLVIKPFETSSLTIDGLSLSSPRSKYPDLGSYTYYFYFNYAATGSDFHRLVLPVYVEPGQTRPVVAYEVGKQHIEGPMEAPPGVDVYMMGLPKIERLP